MRPGCAELAQQRLKSSPSSFRLFTAYLVFVCLFLHLIHGLKKEKTIFCELTNLPSIIDVLGIYFFYFYNGYMINKEFFFKNL